MLVTQVVHEIISLYFDHLSKNQISNILVSLDAQYKFAKEFNTEMNLRFKLQRQGFTTHDGQLPGMLAHEEQSLKVYLSILFKQFFKQGDSSKQLFELCSKVLKDYVLKQSELVSIKS